MLFCSSSFPFFFFPRFIITTCNLLYDLTSDYCSFALPSIRLHLGLSLFWTLFASPHFISSLPTYSTPIFITLVTHLQPFLLSWLPFVLERLATTAQRHSFRFSLSSLMPVFVPLAYFNYPHILKVSICLTLCFYFFWVAFPFLVSRLFLSRCSLLVLLALGFSSAFDWLAFGLAVETCVDF